MSDMGDKSVQKRQYILETARDIFAQKGFKNVTMKDIVDACDISRGGLYLYFASTQEIFWEVLQLETEDSDEVFAKGITRDSTSGDILALFLREQKKELLKKKDHLNVAVYEYFFEYKFPKKDHVIRKQFDVAVKVIEKLIADGVQSGEFVCDDPLGSARNIMYVLEGLKISSQTMGITEDMVNKEILYIMKRLLPPDAE